MERRSIRGSSRRSRTPWIRRAPPLVALVVLLSGCMVGPDYTRPAADVNDVWLQTRDAGLSPGADAEAEWWKTFDDPILNGLVDDAIRQNLSLRIAGVRVLQSMAQRGIAVGQLFPQEQSLGAGIERERFSENPPRPSDYSTEYSAGFDAAWEIDFWGKFRRAIEAADADLDGSLANYDTVMVSLISEVAFAYIDFRTAQARLALARSNVTLQERSLDITQKRHDAGETSELDSTQTTSLLEQTRASVPAFEAQALQAMYRLNVLLGTSPEDLMDRLGDTGTLPAAPATVALGVPADLLRRRPDVRLAERQAAAASALVGVAESDLYPAFTLGGSIGYGADDSGDLFESKSWTGVINPNVSWPIFNYGRIENNVRMQDAAFQASIINYRNSVLSAASEVESGLAAFLGAKRQAGHLVLSVAASQRSVDLSTLQYREGEADYSRVINSLQALAEVQDQLAVTQGQTASNLISTYKALGGGWQVRIGVDVVPDATKAEMRERTDWGEMLDPEYVDGKDLGLIDRHDPSKEADGDVSE